MARFTAELDDEIYRRRVREHQNGGRRANLRATPGFFVNGTVRDVSGGMQALFDAVASKIAGFAVVSEARCHSFSHGPAFGGDLA